MKHLLLAIIFQVSYSSFSQESLLLGEQRVDEIYFEGRTDHVQKISSYSAKYRKDNSRKDSALVGFESYYEDGFIQSKVAFYGKKGASSNMYTYHFFDGLMMDYNLVYIDEKETFGRSGEFTYDKQRRLTYQKHSLANIKYDYFEDGRMKTKSYHYNNGSGQNSEPWVHYYFYDDSLNLIHVDTDENSTSQTSFYNEKNQLVKHDYYPGVAYSTYEYDENGNCKTQIDYELGKKKWDEKHYHFTYNENNQISSSSLENKKGKSVLYEEYFYLENGNLDYIIYLKKGKRKTIKFFTYLSF